LEDFLDPPPGIWTLIFALSFSNPGLRVGEFPKRPPGFRSLSMCGRGLSLKVFKTPGFAVTLQKNYMLPPTVV